MPEYFVFTNSFAAPFFSDSSTKYVEGDTPQEAMAKAVKDYKHPAGLFAAALYESADAYHKGQKPMIKWLSNKAQVVVRFESDGQSHSFYSNEDDTIRIDGVRHQIADPKSGSVVEEE